MLNNDKILVLGASGLVGSSLVRLLEKQNYSSILKPTSQELNLLNQSATLEYFKKHRPQHVILAAAHVGGIQANNIYRADFIFKNLSIQNNVFEAAFSYDVDRLLFLGSSCIYPKLAPQPIKEESLLTSELEPTNEPYAIAKIAGLKLAENFRRQYQKNYVSIMPTNLYGLNDNFHPDNSHVIPGLIRRMAQTITDKKSEFMIWGTGEVRREFLYVDDMASACLHVLNADMSQLPYWLNIGTGEDVTIKNLAQMIGSLMGYKGEYVHDLSKPDGTPRKLLDVSKINKLGWRHQFTLEQGLKITIQHFYEKYGHEFK